MRHVMSFEHLTEDEGTWQYEVFALDSLNRVQLWYLSPFDVDKTWDIGHSKDIPAGSTAENAANLMMLFIQRELTYETYNQLLPGA